MSPVSIDVDAQIENLRGLKTDLEAWYWNAAEAGESSARYALGVAIAQLTQRIAALEEVVRYHGDDVVSVVTLSHDESHALEEALEVLDGELVVDADFRATKLWPRVRNLLAATDDLLLAVARGERTGSEDQDGARRPCVVLPLVRSNR